ncbi:MAG: hypothetical protein K5683_02900 [Prevotella sp.]|nr:hypothetical protein [Prevotella sp.]
MIVLHSFISKKYPKYLKRAVSMLRDVNDGCFTIHQDFDMFVQEIFKVLKEDSAGRYEKGEVTLSRTSGQLQINVKRGLDYAARIYFTDVRTGFCFKFFTREMVPEWHFTPVGAVRVKEGEEVKP